MPQMEIGLLDVVLLVVATWAFWTLLRLINREVHRWHVRERQAQKTRRGT